MSVVAWIVVAVPLGLLVAYLRACLDSREGRLPRHFDFHTYKNRELNQRGLFDKTKWR